MSQIYMVGMLAIYVLNIGFEAPTFPEYVLKHFRICHDNEMLEKNNS
jgi:hypothetical protein